MRLAKKRFRQAALCLHTAKMVRKQKKPGMFPGFLSFTQFFS